MNLTLKNKFTASTRFWFTLSNSCCCLSFVLFFVFYYTQLHAQYYCVRPGHDSHYWDHTLLLSKRAQPGKHCYCRWPGPVAAVIQWNSTNIKAKSFLPGNSWNVLFLPRSLVSLCLPLTWQVFGSATFETNGAFLWLHANFLPLLPPPHPDHTTLGWLSSFSSCSSVVRHRCWRWLSWSFFAKLKMGQLPFSRFRSLIPPTPLLFSVLKMTQVCLFVSASRASCLGTEGRVGSCGGMIWYELKVFPNRLHGVWSCPLLVWRGSLPHYQPVLCYISYSMPPLCFCSSQ